MISDRYLMRSICKIGRKWRKRKLTATEALALIREVVKAEDERNHPLGSRTQSKKERGSENDCQKEGMGCPATAPQQGPGADFLDVERGAAV